MDFSDEAGYRDLEGVKLKCVWQEEIYELWKMSVWDIYAFSYMRKMHF